ncbi:hypothetical protein EBU94_03145 [bacterium]|nr:hypothetical protein [bacterium]
MSDQKYKPDYSLLLTPSQVLEIQNRHNRNDYIYTVTSNERSVSVYGVQHTFKLNDLSGIQDRLKGVDLVLIEGVYSFSMVDTFSKDTADFQVIEQNGEQTYIGWLAKKLNIEVKCWDLSLSDLIKEGAGEFSRLSFLGWLAGNGFKILKSRSKDLDASEWAMQVVKTTGISVTGTEINNAVIHYFGKDFKDLTFDEAEELASPSSSLDTGAIASSMVLKRDRNFLDVVAENLNQSVGSRNIFVSAGLSHAISWKRALEKMLV